MSENLDLEQIEALFRYVEEYPERPQAKRVAEILEALSNYRGDLPPSRNARSLGVLRRALSEYKWAVQVSPSAQGLIAILFPAEGGMLSADAQWGYAAVRDLLSLIPYLGKRPRIRRCAECDGWFFAANREDQQYCNRNCRQRHYDASPKMREHKKLKMREYRADMKGHARNPKSGIGLRPPRKGHSRDL